MQNDVLVHSLVPSPGLGLSVWNLCTALTESFAYTRGIVNDPTTQSAGEGTIARNDNKQTGKSTLTVSLCTAVANKKGGGFIN